MTTIEIEGRGIKMEKQNGVIYEKKGRLAYITIDRPHVRNAVDHPTREKLVAAFMAFKEDSDAWVAILTGSGDKAFCAGADIKYWRDHTEERENLERRRELYDRMKSASLGWLPPSQIWKPIIAAVNGYCLGGGLEIALGCDIIIAAETASFGQPEVTHGWPPGPGLFRLPRKVPRNLAMEMLLTGDPITAQEAYRIGLVNKLVPLADLLPTATKVAERICENPPLAVRAVKELTLRGLDVPMDYPTTAWHLTLDTPLAIIGQSEDAKEGRQAFAEKRKPIFKGR
jgi:enoyl-CoA hydratase/carnithine racemase